MIKTSIQLFLAFLIVSCTPQVNLDELYFSYSPISQIDTSVYEKVVIHGIILNNENGYFDSIFINELNFAFPYANGFDTIIYPKNNEFIIEWYINKPLAFRLSAFNFLKKNLDRVKLKQYDETYNYYLCGKHYLDRLDFYVEPGDSLRIDLDSKDFKPRKKFDIKITGLETKPTFLKDFYIKYSRSEIGEDLEKYEKGVPFEKAINIIERDKRKLERYLNSNKEVISKSLYDYCMYDIIYGAANAYYLEYMDIGYLYFLKDTTGYLNANTDYFNLPKLNDEKALISRQYRIYLENQINFSLNSSKNRIIEYNLPSIDKYEIAKKLLDGQIRYYYLSSMLGEITEMTYDESLESIFLDYFESYPDSKYSELIHERFNDWKKSE